MAQIQRSDPLLSSFATSCIIFDNSFTNPYVKVHQEMLKRETCEAWRSGLTDVSETELVEILGGIRNESAYFAKKSDEFESEIRYEPIEMCTKRLVEAFIQLELKNMVDAEAALREARMLIQHCLQREYFSKEYVGGFLYVLDNLQYSVHAVLRPHMWDQHVFYQCLHHLNSYAALTAKNKIGVLVMKDYFIGILSPTSYSKQIGIIGKIISLDPGNADWHYRLCLIEKSRRQSVAVGRNRVSAEEENAISRALKCAVSGQNPKILNAYIYYLSEKVRQNYNERNVQQIQFGSNKIGSLLDAARSIRANADIILGLDPVSVRFNTTIARIFTSTLPRIYQDWNFALSCLKRVVLFCPMSCTANHHLGKFYVEAQNFNKALKYLVKAHELDDRYTNATLDLLKVLLGDVAAHRVAISKILNGTGNFVTKPHRDQANILLMKGVFSFLTGDKMESVSCFLEAISLDRQITEKFFHDLFYTSSRFYWNRNVLSRSNITNELRLVLQDQCNTTDDPIRKRKLAAMSNAAANPARLRRSVAQKRVILKTESFERGNSNSLPVRNGFNPYAVLGLEFYTSKSEIKCAYGERVRELCRDDSQKSGSGRRGAMEKIMLINKAWEILISERG